MANAILDGIFDPFQIITDFAFGEEVPSDFPKMIMRIRYQVVDSNEPANGSYSGSIPLVYWADSPIDPNPDPGFEGINGDVTQAYIDVQFTIGEDPNEDPPEDPVESFDVTLMVVPDEPFGIEWSAELFLTGFGPFPPDYGPDPVNTWSFLVGRFPPPWGEGGPQTLILRWHRGASATGAQASIEVIQEPPDAS